MIVFALLVLLFIASITDLSNHQIPNWLTYSGIILAWILNGFINGWSGLETSLTATIACGFLMVVCYLFFQFGGGDVKILTMVAAFLGLEKGIEAMLWTFVVAAIFGIGILIYEKGALNILRESIKYSRMVFLARGWLPLTTQERQPLRRNIYLAPATLIAVLLVLGEDYFL